MPPGILMLLPEGFSAQINGTKRVPVFFNVRRQPRVWTTLWVMLLVVVMVVVKGSLAVRARR